MGWQEYIVGIIGLAVVALLVRGAFCLFRQRRRGGCAACASTNCPLKK